eukprot:tig00000145_g8847.t1
MLAAGSALRRAGPALRAGASTKASVAPPAALFFDLDDTLYPRSSGVAEHVYKRICSYMTTRLSIPEEKAGDLAVSLYIQHGTTLKGLQTDYKIDVDDYFDYVHKSIPYERLLREDPQLCELLESINAPKYIFTNADDEHARSVLARLGIAHCFQGIIDVRAIDFHNKPHPTAFARALKLAAQEVPGQVLFFDDSIRNVTGAKGFGLRTCLVGTAVLHPDADYCIATIHEMLKVPEIQMMRGAGPAEGS